MPCARARRGSSSAYFSHLWYPALKFAEAVGLQMPQPPQNVLSPADVRALVALADFEPVKSEISACCCRCGCSGSAG